MNIQEIKKDLSDLGLTENLDLATLIYLAASMRKTAYKISVLVNGPAGLGKSHVARTVLKLFPQADIISSSRITPAGLMGMEDLSGKILFVYERFNDPQYAQYVRELISEGEVVYTTASGSQRLKGPVTLIETTVNLETIGIENRSRCFVVGINASTLAKGKVLDRMKERRTVGGLVLEENDEALIEKHKRVQLELDPQLCVMIPFAREIRFHATSQHAPRILHRTLNVISAIAHLDQRQREKKERGGVKYIEATREDFESAREVLVNLNIDEDEGLLPPEIAEFVEALRLGREALCRKGIVTRNDFVEIANSQGRRWSEKLVYKYVGNLCRAGFVDALPERGVKNSIRYRPNKDFLKAASSTLSVGCYQTLSLP